MEPAARQSSQIEDNTDWGKKQFPIVLKIGRKMGCHFFGTHFSPDFST